MPKEKFSFLPSYNIIEIMEIVQKSKYFQRKLQGKGSNRLGVKSGECFQSLSQIENIELKLATTLILCVQNKVVLCNAVAHLSSKEVL